MLEVIKPGLETTVQDWPGRIGYWEQGFPFSGPMDDWSFRLANLLVDNPADAAGLECQFTGPTLRFGRDAVVAVTGAGMQPTLDNAPVPMWESFAVRAGQALTLGFARLGARAYLAVAGGIDTTPVLGSRATFHQAGIGGLDGYALKAGQSLPLGDGTGTPGRCVRPACRPPTRHPPPPRGRRAELGPPPRPGGAAPRAAPGGQPRLRFGRVPVEPKARAVAPRLHGPVALQEPAVAGLVDPVVIGAGHDLHSPHPLTGERRAAFGAHATSRRAGAVTERQALLRLERVAVEPADPGLVEGRAR
ncbi:MAG: hypothetical protein OXB97_08115, partial [Rhodospirillales bacterium]|nr:hypothetical protein [Rhodospirillales bacterium]